MITAVAFDFGASSGRAIKAVYDESKITYEEIHRFENIPVTVDGHICHNTDMILKEINKALEKTGKIDCMAFDTWGVDYGLLNKEGKLISPPCHYRDERTADALKNAEKLMTSNMLYEKTGNQIMPINTLFQLMCDSKIKEADKLLFMPDLFGYLLTGKAKCEYTIASTSQMLDPKKKQWSEDVLNVFGIKKNLFAPLAKTASVLGEYKGAKVISVAGHDTQCAVCAIPCINESDVAFLSCGTWSLIGCELDEPVLTKQSCDLELSNELGANGKINYLKNISGLWLIQQLKRELNAQGASYSYNDLEQLARKSEPFKFFIDPDAQSLSAHGNLKEKICRYLKNSGQGEPETIGEIVRCIYESLALKYRYALNQISTVTNKSFSVLHLLGGGTKDGFLCETAASCLGIPVAAGPVEATALGNIILQLIAMGEIKDVQEGRKIISQSEQIKTYMPKACKDLDKAYEKYVNIIERFKEEN